MIDCRADNASVLSCRWEQEVCPSKPAEQTALGSAHAWAVICYKLQQRISQAVDLAAAAVGFERPAKSSIQGFVQFACALQSSARHTRDVLDFLNVVH